MSPEALDLPAAAVAAVVARVGSASEAARLLGLSYNTTLRRLRAAGVEPGQMPWLHRAQAPEGEILRLWEEGYPKAEIARRVACSIRQVRTVIAATGEPPEPRRLVTDAERAQIEADAEAGIPACRTAGRLGLSPATLSRLRHKLGFVSRVRHPDPEARLQVIREMRAAGCTLEAIGRRVGLPASGVQYWCLKFGIEKGGAK